MDPAEPESIWEALFERASRNHASEIAYELDVMVPGRSRKVSTIDAALEKGRNFRSGRRGIEECGAFRVGAESPWGRRDRQGMLLAVLIRSGRAPGTLVLPVRRAVPVRRVWALGGTTPTQ